MLCGEKRNPNKTMPRTTNWCTQKPKSIKYKNICVCMGNTVRLKSMRMNNCNRCQASVGHGLSTATVCTLKNNKNNATTRHTTSNINKHDNNSLIMANKTSDATRNKKQQEKKQILF